MFEPFPTALNTLTAGRLNIALLFRRMDSSEKGGCLHEKDTNREVRNESALTSVDSSHRSFS